MTKMPSESNFPQIEFEPEAEEQFLRRVMVTLMERMQNAKAVPGDQERLEAVIRARAELIKRDGVTLRRRK